MKVAELIALLQAMDPNAVVVIEDADTKWLLDPIAVEACEHHASAVKLTCDYSGGQTLGDNATDEPARNPEGLW